MSVAQSAVTTAFPSVVRAPSIARGFAGDGFYVQAGAHVSSRQPVQMRPGDVCAHSFDLQHGVDVSGGHRVSVILWFADSVESCEKKVQPWHRASAEAGNPDAQYNWGKTLVDQKWTQRGQSFMEAAAVQGGCVSGIGALLQALPFWQR